MTSRTFLNKWITLFPRLDRLLVFRMFPLKSGVFRQLVVLLSIYIMFPSRVHKFVFLTTTTSTTTTTGATTSRAIPGQMDKVVFLTSIALSSSRMFPSLVDNTSRILSSISFSYVTSEKVIIKCYDVNRQQYNKQPNKRKRKRKRSKTDKNLDEAE